MECHAEGAKPLGGVKAPKRTSNGTPRGLVKHFFFFFFLFGVFGIWVSFFLKNASCVVVFFSRS